MDQSNLLRVEKGPRSKPFLCTYWRCVARNVFSELKWWNGDAGEGRKIGQHEAQIPSFKLRVELLALEFEADHGIAFHRLRRFNFHTRAFHGYLSRFITQSVRRRCRESLFCKTHGRKPTRTNQSDRLEFYVHGLFGRFLVLAAKVVSL